MKRYWIGETFKNVYFVYDTQSKKRSYASNNIKSFIYGWVGLFNSTSTDLNISERRAKGIASIIFEFDDIKEVIEAYPEEMI